MKANEINLHRFLAQNDTQFVIPVYQRNYDWTHTQCKQLFFDILSVGYNDSMNAHFIGSIVYVHDDVYSASRLRELTIIDGQQRLTTITLIYIALYRLAKLIGNTPLVNRIHETYLINKFADDEEKLKLRPTENNNIALKYLLNGTENDDFPDFSLLVENYNYFRSVISEENLEQVLKGLSKLMFVEISLDKEKDDPQRIFESLNSTGLELSQADLIRNYILMGLNRKDQSKVYENYWEAIEKLARDESINTSKVSDFIRDYLTLENKKIPNKNNVYSEFKLKYPTSNVSGLENILKPLKNLVKHYNKLLNPPKEQDVEIRLHLSYINRLEINVAYPFLMKVYDDYVNDIISKQDFVAVLELIQSFTWRRFVVGLPTNALNKIFMRLYEDVLPNNYLKSIEISLLKKKGTQRFPRNNEVSAILRDKDMYGIKPKNRVYYFERLENFNNKEHVTIEGNNNITIEHIFPQNPDAKWKVQLGDVDYTIIKDKYLNTVANLTLSGNNGQLGNKTFLQKKEMNIEGKEQGYKYSRLWLNRYLQEINSWGLSELEQRFTILEKRFFEVWPIPEHDVQEYSDFNEVNIFDAEEPTGKKLEYVVFFNQKIEVTDITKLYIEVIKTLFELQSHSFFTTDLMEKLSITKDAGALRVPISLNESYYFESHLDSRGKFDRIKRALTILDCEDELTIKYREPKVQVDLFS